jgi:BMFP domain-containing protein YqiC
MIDVSQIDELARRLSGLVPPALRGDVPQGLREDLQENFKSVLQTGLARLDLVTREEFDVQRAVLSRTREQLDALRGQVAELEALLAARGDDTTPNR